MYSIHSYTCFDEYNISGIIDNKLLTFVTRGHGSECEEKAWCLLLIWKKKKQGKTKTQVKKIHKNKMTETVHKPLQIESFSYFLTHFHLTLLSVPCFASVLCLLFGNAFSLFLHRFSSSKLYMKSNPFIKLYWTIPFHRNLSYQHVLDQCYMISHLFTQ